MAFDTHCVRAADSWKQCQMSSNFKIEIGENPDARAIVERGLFAFNAQFVGQRRYEKFEVYAKNDSGQIIGGMFGQSGMDWLYIDYLWIEESHRGSGLGAQLLAMAEQEALTRKCVGVFLYTYSFQALAFYEKNGFKVMGMLDNCPAGHQRIYLSKPVPSGPTNL